MRKLKAEDRYRVLRESVEARSVLSLGLALFRGQPGRPLAFHCAVFNFLLLREDAFVVDPASLRFLSANGLSLDRLFAEATPYRKQVSPPHLTHRAEPRPTTCPTGCSDGCWRRACTCWCTTAWWT